jgi:PleD family two-component response regulator
VMALGIPHGTSGAGDRVTISLGVLTTRCEPGTSPDALLELADEQLYAAKSAGRNRIAAAA